METCAPLFFLLQAMAAYCLSRVNVKVFAQPLKAKRKRCRELTVSYRFPRANAKVFAQPFFKGCQKTVEIEII